jgi:cytochrome c2
MTTSNLTFLIPRFALLACCVLLGLSLAFAAAAEQTKSAARPASAQKGAEDAPKADVKKGKQVYEDFCEICHFSANTEKKIGPGLKSIYKRGKFADGRKVDDAAMKKWIENGGKDMPEFKDTLKPEEIRSLIAYLKTI